MRIAIVNLKLSIMNRQNGIETIKMQYRVVISEDDNTKSRTTANKNMNKKIGSSFIG